MTSGLVTLPRQLKGLTAERDAYRKRLDNALARNVELLAERNEYRSENTKLRRLVAQLEQTVKLERSLRPRTTGRNQHVR